MDTLRNNGDFKTITKSVEEKIISLWETNFKEREENGEFQYSNQISEEMGKMISLGCYHSAIDLYYVIEAVSGMGSDNFSLKNLNEDYSKNFSYKKLTDIFTSILDYKI